MSFASLYHIISDILAMLLAHGFGCHWAAVLSYNIPFFSFPLPCSSSLPPATSALLTPNMLNASRLLFFHFSYLLFRLLLYGIYSTLCVPSTSLFSRYNMYTSRGYQINDYVETPETLNIWIHKQLIVFSSFLVSFSFGSRSLSLPFSIFDASV